MFVMFEKEVVKEKAVIGVNANQVIKLEPGPPSRGGQTTRISYSNGQSDVVLGAVERTLERFNDDADVTSLG
jgi:hypothetical protein